MICNRHVNGMLWSILCVSVIAIGCETKQSYTPPPTRRGIPDPVILDQLDEMISEMTQHLAVALPNQPEVRDSDYQYVLAIAGFSVAGFSDPGRFHVALEEIQTRLMGNEAIVESFIVVNTHHNRGDAFLASVSGDQMADFDDPAQRGANASSKTQYDPRYIYFMTGRFYQMDEPGGRKSYRLFLDIEKPMAKQRILTREFKRDLQWNPRAARWEVKS